MIEYPGLSDHKKSDYEKCGWTHDCTMTSISAHDYVALDIDHQGLLDAIASIQDGQMPKLSSQAGLSLLRKGADAQAWLDHEGRVRHTTSINHRQIWFTTNVDDLATELRDWVNCD